MIDFVIILSDLQLHVLDTLVKRGAELDQVAGKDVGQSWCIQTYCLDCWLDLVVSVDLEVAYWRQ